MGDLVKKEKIKKMLRRSLRLSKAIDEPTRSETQVEDWVMRQLEEVKQKRRENGQAEETTEQARATMTTPKVKKVEKDMGGDDIDVYLAKKEKRKQYLLTPSNSRINRLAKGTRSSSMKKTAPSTADKQRKQATRVLAFTAAGSKLGIESDFAPILETPEKPIKPKTPAKSASKVKTPSKPKTPAKSDAKTPVKTQGLIVKTKTPAKVAAKTPVSQEKTPSKAKMPSVAKIPAKSETKPLTNSILAAKVKPTSTKQLAKAPVATVPSAKSISASKKENIFKPTTSNEPKFNFTGGNATAMKFEANGETATTFKNARERRLAYSKQLMAKHKRQGVKSLTKKKRNINETKNTLLESKRNI